MFCAPVVIWETSEPPTTPRGTSRSAPGLTTFMTRASLPPVARGQLDLDGRLGGRLVVDLEGGVVDVEAHLEHALEHAAQLVPVLAGADDDVGGEGREARGHLA